MSTANTSKNRKRVIAALSTIAIAGSIGIGGMFLNDVPQDKLELGPVAPIETVQTSVPKPTPTPVVKPSPSPKASFVPSKIPLPTKQPKAIEVIEVQTPEVLEVVEIPPAKVDTLVQYDISGKETSIAKYEIKKIDGYRSQFSIDVPEALSADMFELYLNQQYIDKQLLPSGKIISPPLIFTDMDALEVHIIKLEQVIGIGRFDNGTLTIYLKDGVTHE